VGPFAVAIAQAYDCEVTGVCSTGKIDFVRSLGVTDVIDYSREDYVASGRQWDRIVDVAAHRGILACVVRSRRAASMPGPAETRARLRAL
jgi:NADPH:quinone reductase-like Zn-dependent oxidoreductase